jgi:hypothetical protein|tara:strand:+ start:701 stop:1096 length:396 start_codon:yes stop_codon:yes gene_type:complete
MADKDKDKDKKKKKNKKTKIFVSPELSTNEGKDTKNFTKGITIGGGKGKLKGNLNLKSSKDTFPGGDQTRKSAKLEGGGKGLTFYIEKGKSNRGRKDKSIGLTFSKTFNKGGRVGFKSGGLAKRGKGCEIK